MLSLTKKNLFCLSLALTIVFGLIIVLGTDACYSNPVCREVRRNVLNDYLSITMIFPILLLISVITYRLKSTVFESWKKFAIWAVPLVLLLTFLITRDSGGSNFFTMDYSLYFLAILYGLFFLISLTIIAVSTIRSR